MATETVAINGDKQPKKGGLNYFYKLRPSLFPKVHLFHKVFNFNLNSFKITFKTLILLVIIKIQIFGIFTINIKITIVELN
ncbi:MAG: hypothetical protein ACI9IA_002116 [Enterobacterales bacterium]|jgi:hypothetical protein